MFFRFVFLWYFLFRCIYVNAQNRMFYRANFEPGEQKSCFLREICWIFHRSVNLMIKTRMRDVNFARDAFLGPGRLRNKQSDRQLQRSVRCYPFYQHCTTSFRARLFLKCSIAWPFLKFLETFSSTISNWNFRKFLDKWKLIPNLMPSFAEAKEINNVWMEIQASRDKTISSIRSGTRFPIYCCNKKKNVMDFQ